MNNQITKTQCKSYRDDGYIIIDDFLDDTELNIWQEAVEEAVAARENKRLPYETAQIPVKAQNEIVFQQRINLWMDHPGVRRLMFDDRIGKMAADLEGVEGIRIWHDQVLTKQPWANPTTWHQDNTKWSFSSAQAITIWVALDDVTLQNGCMFFLPGSHKKRLEDHPAAGNSVGAMFATYPELGGLEPTPVVMRAGGCSFHNGLMVHAAHANMTPYPRRAFTCAYMPDGSLFNGIPNVLPDSMLKALNIGDVLADETQNPLIFSIKEGI
jgi:phytanoyl-CoA hydroxylase